MMTRTLPTHNALTKGILIRSVRSLGFLALTALLSFNATAKTGRQSVKGAAWSAAGPFRGYEPGQEILEKRTKYAKHFTNADGTYTLQAGDVYHYMDAQGAWQDIDLTVRAATDGFTNETNEFKSHFPASAAGGAGVAMKLNYKTTFEWWRSPEISVASPNGVRRIILADNANGVVSSKTVSYNNTYPGISEEFVMLKNGIENNTLLHSLNPVLAAADPASTIEFTQTVPLQAGWKVDVGGNIKTASFTANDFHISIPGTEQGLFFSPVVVWDATLNREDAMYALYAPAGKLTTKQQNDRANHVFQASYNVSFIAGAMKVSTRIPAAWLQESGRAYPVTVDPTVTITPPASTGSFYGPTTNWYGYQRHADLYLASELGVSNVLITNIEYNRTSTTGTNSAVPVKIWMSTTTATTLPTAAWNSATYTGSLSPVYNATVDIYGTTTGWKMINLASNFLIPGASDNLIIMVYDAYGGSGSAKYINENTTSMTGRQAFYRQDGTDPGDGVTLAVEAKLPEIRLTYIPAGPPTCVAAPLTPANGSTTACAGNTLLSWNSRPGAIGYDVFLDPGAGAPTTRIGNNIPDTFINVTTTVPAGLYTWKIIPRNNVGMATGCSNFTFTSANGAIAGANVTTTPDTVICPYQAVTFTAAPISGGTAPTFQWQKNGVNVGSNSNIYRDSTLNNNDKVKVIVTTSLTTGCITSATGSSREVNITWKPIPPSTITASGKTAFCTGGGVTLSVPAGATAYQWELNGVNIATNSTSPTYTAIYSGSYVAIVTGSNGCYIRSVPMQVNAVDPPIAAITRNLNILSTAPYYATFQWYKNDLPISGQTSATYTFSTDGRYSVKVTDTNGCAGTSSYLYVNELSISNTTSGAEISIYPNPATDIVKIESSAAVNIRINSVDGREVISRRVVNEINISHLANGVYMLYITDKNDRLLKVEKLIKRN